MSSLSKEKIASSFSAVAHSYDNWADIQRKLGQQLAQYLPDQPALRVLDLGSGTGFFSNQLQEQYPQAQLLSLDLAEGMLRYAKQQRPLANQHWLCADAEQLPIASASVSIIFSNLAIQWCQQPAQLFVEIHRVLKPQGQFIFSSLGPGTLAELKNAWSSVDKHVHVNQFIDWASLMADLPKGLTVAKQFIESEIFWFNQVADITSNLKGVGANNMNSEQKLGLTSPKQLKEFCLAYEKLRDAKRNKLPVTYEVYYGCLQKISE